MTRRTRLWLALAIAVSCVLGVAGYGAFRFLAKKPGPPPEAPVLVPARWAEFRTSAGHEEHVGKRGIECKSCHAYEKEGFVKPEVAVCGACHASESLVAHRGDAARPTDCLTCHVFAPDRKAPTCISCHAVNAGLVGNGSFAGVPGVTEGGAGDASGVGGDAGARVEPITVHATTECSTCHNPHRVPSGASVACTSCHEERASSHAAHAGSAGCADCHAPHTPAAAARFVCASCHAQPAGPKPAGHESCLTCHSPHDSVAANATSVTSAAPAASSVCVGCHGSKPTLAAASVPAHAVCTSCHTPHDPGAAASSCAGCHANIEVRHGTKDACVTCHEAHPTDHGQSATTKVSTCTSCHANVARGDTGAHAGGITCVRCHQEHDFDPPKDDVALCSSCHTRETTLTRASAGHRVCASCHGPSAHAPIAVPACGSCHEAEQSTAPKGHQLCSNCHEPHSGGSVSPPVTCASCHQNKTNGPHAAVAGGCATCHRPHGPKGPAAPPACTTCHQAKELPALHTVAAHAVCATCHSSHEGPRADRVTCTSSCHTDRKTHQPDARVCSGCHVFRR